MVYNSKLYLLKRHDKLTRIGRIILRQPCKPGMNLKTCPEFSKGQYFGVAKMWKIPLSTAADGDCPACYHRDQIDERYIRMIRIERYGVRFGLGPRTSDPGCEISCVIM